MGTQKQDGERYRRSPSRGTLPGGRDLDTFNSTAAMVTGPGGTNEKEQDSHTAARPSRRLLDQISTHA